MIGPGSGLELKPYSSAKIIYLPEMDSFLLFCTRHSFLHRATVRATKGKTGKIEVVRMKLYVSIHYMMSD